ncbi:MULTISPECIES: CorA family divalent cation transporter [unclassified Actinotalea]|uniref:CorA family divalent cation transporter n=1 Tax=unclassified Actinotalea TaxID=2638618 RepID=UPI0015F6423F|nr:MULTISPECIES: CorA family divalent cation transporter [unclassified Actinotalea]
MTLPSVRPSEPGGGAPVPARVWVDGTDGWRPWRDGGASDLRDGVHGLHGPAWVVAEDAPGLLAACGLLGVHPRTVAVVGRHVQAGGHRRVRVERGAGDDVVLTLPTVSFVAQDRDVRTGWVTGLLSGGTVVMLEEGDAGAVAAAATGLVADGSRAHHAVHAVLAGVLRAVVAAAFDVEDDVADAVTETEKLVFSSDPGDGVAEDVYALKREIAEARRALMPLTGALPELVEELSSTGEESRETAWLARAQAAVDRLDGRLDQHDGLLSDMLSVHLARVSVQQNEDMRRISAWAAIIAVPTFVAGLYGMNFEFIPGEHWRYGFAAALLVMAASAALLWGGFRRSGWWWGRAHIRRRRRGPAPQARAHPPQAQAQDGRPPARP